MMVVCFS